MLVLFQLVVLFFVIFDPPMSFAVFSITTQNLDDKERRKIAALAISVAAVLSYGVLLLGPRLLDTFSTNLEDFRVAGGIILGFLGIKMALGYPIAKLDPNNSSKAIAAIIATPLLTGPAAITALILNSSDYGLVKTALAVTIVLAFTAVIFFQAPRVQKYLGTTSIQVISTILGLITVAWGVKFIRIGLGI
ncbi:MAG: MarC family protein [Candidatus Woesearchaeota archaeon]